MRRLAVVACGLVAGALCLLIGPGGLGGATSELAAASPTPAAASPTPTPGSPAPTPSASPSTITSAPRPPAQPVRDPRSALERAGNAEGDRATADAGRRPLARLLALYRRHIQE